MAASGTVVRGMAASRRTTAPSGRRNSPPTRPVIALCIERCAGAAGGWCGFGNTTSPHAAAGVSAGFRRRCGRRALRAQSGGRWGGRRVPGHLLHFPPIHHWGIKRPGRPLGVPPGAVMEKDTPANHWQPQSADDADSPDFSGFPSACIGVISRPKHEGMTSRQFLVGIIFHQVRGDCPVKSSGTVCAGTSRRESATGKTARPPHAQTAHTPRRRF